MLVKTFRHSAATKLKLLVDLMLPTAARVIDSLVSSGSPFLTRLLRKARPISVIFKTRYHCLS